MKNNIIKTIELSFIEHATENGEKILSVIEDKLKIDKKKFTYFIARGHFENEIKLFKSIINDENVDKCIRNIMNKIDHNEKSFLLDNIENHIDKKSNFYIRIDKQKLFSNIITTSEKDAIRIKIKHYKDKTTKEIIEYYQHLWILRTINWLGKKNVTY